MATKIFLKQSSTAGSAPSTVDLDTGEIAINLADRKIYVDNGTTVERLDGAYISADAPSSPTEGDLWYDTTNNLLKTHNGSGWAASGYTYTGGNAINVSGTEINHADTSTQASVNNSGTTVIQDVTLDTYGHVTGLTSKSLSASDFPHSLEDHDDVTITTPTDNQVLAYDSATGEWINQTPSDAGLLTGNETITLTGDLSGSGTTSINAQIASNVVGAAELNVTGNGTTAQFLRSDGDGSFTWATPANTTYSAGTGLDLTGTTFSLNLNELPSTTANTDGDFFAVVDSADGSQHKIAKGSIQISGFDNDAGYITGYTETDTLHSVTSRTNGNTTTNSVTVGSLSVTNGATVGTNLTVTGNLTVNGSTTTVSSNEVNIGDAIILLNSNETAAPSQNGGIEIERGTETNVSFVWDETADKWSLGNQELANVIIDGGSY